MSGGLAGLTPSALACLWCMAVNARDSATQTDPERVYFRGWDHLAMCALGIKSYDDTAKKRVMRAVAELVRAGLIKPVGRRHGVRHGRAMYRLTLMWGDQ